MKFSSALIWLERTSLLYFSRLEVIFFTESWKEEFLPEASSLEEFCGEWILLDRICPINIWLERGALAFV